MPSIPMAMNRIWSSSCGKASLSFPNYPSSLWKTKKIVGHILFTRAAVNGTQVLALAPLSVLPEYQNRGIGQALIREGHRVAKRLGYPYCVVLGHKTYYPRLGYVPASQYGIKAPFEVEDECFMAVRLGEVIGNLNGTMEYDEIVTY